MYAIRSYYVLLQQPLDECFVVLRIGVYRIDRERLIA